MQYLHVTLSIRFFTDQKCFGPGVATLLHRVEEQHSLRSAALSMEMAYSKAWKIIRTAEQCLGTPLLHSSTGGKNGGGAVLTEAAKSLLALYDEYCAKLRGYAEGLFEETFSDWTQTYMHRKAPVDSAKGAAR